jgi:CRISPR type III-A-associated protein Csm2
LQGGYFDEKGNLRPEMITKTAIEVAHAIGGPQHRERAIKAAQLRRFFAKARYIEQRLDAGQPFASLKSEILVLQPMAADSVRKKRAPDEFKEFIDRNTSLAVTNEESFRKGFVQHFQSVVAYHGYYYRG